MLGSKIEHLTILKAQNFQVADFEVIRSEDVLEQCDDLDRIIREHQELPVEARSCMLKDYIAKHIHQNKRISLKCELYAVRSSSSIEDGKKDSFAGQFDTYLNVQPQELDARITDCFQSLYHENVLRYVMEKKIKLSDLKMNVIVQNMIQSEYSGIIFTSNPQGLLNESVIVVGEGLGENVVSDKVETTSYYYNLNDRLYYYEGEHNYLDRKMVEQLIDISERIRELFSEPMDIEFGIKDQQIYLFQARSITTIHEEHPLILDNSNIVESYPGISLPLTISFVNSVYSGIFESVSRRVLKNEKLLMRYQDVFSNMVGASNGRIYYKISNWYTIIKFLPFHKKIIPVWQEMLGVKNKGYEKEEVALSPFARAMTYINSFYEMLCVSRNMKVLNERFQTINQEFYRLYNSRMTEQEIFDLYQKLETKLLSCWDVTLLNDTYTFICIGLLKARLKKKYQNAEEMANAYISGITNIESMKPVKELITLAYQKDQLSDEEYHRRFSQYIEQYGDRNLEELKLESLTFRTNPELLADKISEYRSDMKRLKERYDDMNPSHEKTGKVNDHKEDPLTRYLIRLCMKGIGNREISRLNRSRIYGIVRHMFLRLGEIYSEQGLIKEQRDVFYLQINEIKQLMHSKGDMKNTVHLRKAEYRLFECLPAYSRLIFMEQEFDKHHKKVNKTSFQYDENQLQGIPCSNGTVRGKALVIRNVNEARHVDNQILITPMTDPGWVFLLATAKGVISEKGSLLSHTAIISRELKIPSIVGVEHLMDTIKTGDEIEMDGTTGMIQIIRQTTKE